MDQPKLALPITGMGIVSAAGRGVEATAARLFAGSPVSMIDPEESRFFKLRDFNGSAEEFAPNLLALAATEEALKDAGLEGQELTGLRVGVCIGSTAGCTNFQEDFGRDFYTVKFPDPAPLDQYFHNNTAQFLARRLGCRGPVQMLSNACTSGADAIGVAASWLDADLCDAVICGGNETVLPRMFYGFRSLMLCAPDSCKPFDRQRQGLILGEGAGILILEKSSSKRQRARGKFLGYGTAGDAFHPTSPDPEARGLDLAVRFALARTGVALDEIDFINAHATGTPHNDLAEGRWIYKNLPQTLVVANKGYTGHTLGAAGAIEAVLTLMSLERGMLFPSLGFAEMDPEIGIAPTQSLERGAYKKALSFSLGFGGINSALLMGSVT